MKTPLAKYDIPENSVDYQHLENMVWAAILDKRFKIEVVRTSDNTGQYTIYDSQNNDAVLCDEPTYLAYGARFGPDVDDMAQWQNKACEIVDAI
jgi:hypothetical protein